MRVRVFFAAQIALVLTCFAAIVLTLKLSTYRFGAFDLSPLIDSGWRVRLGQIPGKDFINTAPPSLYLFAALLYRWFGVTWRALILGEALFFAALSLAGLRISALLRRPLGEKHALFLLVVYTVGQMIPLVGINYPWHSAMAQSLGLYAVFATLAVLKSDTFTAAVRAEVWGHLSLACTFLVLSKPNTAYPAILVCLLALLLARRSQRLVFATVLGALVLSSFALAAAHLNLFSMMLSYRGLTGRLVPKPLFYGLVFPILPEIGLEILASSAIVASATALFALTLWQTRTGLLHRPIDVLALGAAVTSALGLATNYDLRVIDLPMLLIGMAIFAVAGSGASVLLRRRVLWSAMGLLLLATYEGGARLRFQIMGLWGSDECGPRVPFHDRFFGNLHVCEPFIDVLAQSDEALKAVNHSSVFFGPDLESMYARDNIASPLHLPLWWHPGTSFPYKRLPDVIHAWEADRFDIVIFVHGNRQNIPGEILADIARDYEPVPSTGATKLDAVDVYRRRIPQ